MLVAGCGGNDDGPSEVAVQQQIDQARKEGAREARQRDRIESLQSRVKHLERDRTAATTDIEGQPDETATGGVESTVLRTFHTPNVSCEIRSDGALCSVDSSDETFVFEAGGVAYVESGSRVSQGAGPLASWDSTVSAGSVTCTIPPLDEPSGITCVDSNTGHGFEASRVPARQQAY